MDNKVAKNRFADQTQHVYVIVVIVVMAIALRVWAALPVAQHHSDEFGQYLEQAHRLVFGYGLVPWEYRADMRSWLPL